MPIFDCKNKPDPICPYCGKGQSNAEEFELEDGDCAEIVCGHCELTFIATARIKYTYDTKPTNPSDVREYCTFNNLPIPDCVKE